MSLDTRILLYEPVDESEPTMATALEELGATVAVCLDRLCLLEQLVAFQPRVIVFVLRASGRADATMLEMLRRLAPGVPLAVLVDEVTPFEQRIERDVRPMWIGVRPGGGELPASLRSALCLGITRAAG